MLGLVFDIAINHVKYGLNLKANVIKLQDFLLIKDEKIYVRHV